MKIDSKFIEDWEPKYDEIESDEGEYNALIKRVCEEIQTKTSISLETFKRIINWKSPRAKGKIKWDEYSAYKKAFRLILNPKYLDKMSFLTVLPGIGAPIASTILHFIFPDIFAIYDFRTVEVLYSFCYLTRKTVSQSSYREFQTVIMNIKVELHNYNLRQIDRALFAYHKINLGQLKNMTSKNNKCHSSKLAKNRYIGNASIPEIVKHICDDLGEDGKEIRRKDIITKAKENGINESSVLPADYCDNTLTGQWSKHSFLHSIGPGRYIGKVQGQNK